MSVNHNVQYSGGDLHTVCVDNTGVGGYTCIYVYVHTILE